VAAAAAAAALLRAHGAVLRVLTRQLTAAVHMRMFARRQAGCCTHDTFLAATDATHVACGPCSSRPASLLAYSLLAYSFLVTRSGRRDGAVQSTRR
jgi:hypothetical protein